MTMEKQGSIIANRRKKLQDLKDKKVDLFPNDYRVLHTVRDIQNAIKDSPEDPKDQISENESIFVVASLATKKFPSDCPSAAPAIEPTPGIGPV